MRSAKRMPYQADLFVSGGGELEDLVPARLSPVTERLQQLHSVTALHQILQNTPSNGTSASGDTSDGHERWAWSVMTAQRWKWSVMTAQRWAVSAMAAAQESKVRQSQPADISLCPAADADKPSSCSLFLQRR